MVTLEVGFSASIEGFQLEASFTASGGITALFGPSGAGKSLTLRHLAGLDRPAEGSIRLGGRTLFNSEAGVHLPPRARRVGMVFQDYALFPHMTVGRNIAFGLADMPSAARRDRVAELLEMTGLPGFENRIPAGLSGGERQRVALARALAPRPELLLLDEPFAALDFRIRRGLRDALREVQRTTDTPMILVTHSLPDVRELSDTLVLMDEGRVVATGATGEMLRAPPTPVAAELLQEE